MAIKSCRECKGQISSKAESCPHCGARLKAQQYGGGCGSLLLLALIIVIGAAIVGESNPPARERTPPTSEPTTPAPDLPDDYHWILKEWQSDKDGSTNVRLSTVSGNQPTDAYGRATVPGLYLYCRENETNVAINWRQYLGIDRARIAWRIDDQPLQRDQWVIATNREAVGLWRGGNAIAFIKRLIDAERLRVWITPYGQNEITARFRVAHLSEKLQTLRTACHW